MLTVAFLSQKGGAGKTTLACAMAVAGERAGFASVLIDLDSQASAAAWANLREADTPIVTNARADRLDPVLIAARDAGARLVVIDTAPRVADSARTAARAADLVLIPCRPAAADLAAIGASIELAQGAGKTPSAVLNAAPVRNPLVAEAREAIVRYDIDMAPTVIHQRIDHVHAFTAGLAATELAPRSKAAAELRALFAWLCNGTLPLEQVQKD